MVTDSQRRRSLGARAPRSAHTAEDRKRLLLVAEDPAELRVLRSALGNGELDVVEALVKRLPPPRPISDFDIALVALTHITCGWDRIVGDLKSGGDCQVLCLLPPTSHERIAELGQCDADDILFLPLRPDELRTRVQLLLWKEERRRELTWPLIERRRIPHQASSSAASSSLPEEDPFLIDDREKTVTIGKRRIRLSPKEYRLLVLLASDPGRTFSIAEIGSHLWPKRQHLPAQVHQCVYQLRKKVEKDPADPQWVQNVTGFGYRIRSTANG